ncbi:TPA: glycosyltransferase family 4 protein [Klebsiella pneumoniae]
MIVNLSRLGKSGTGMWIYSLKFLKSLNKLGELDGIICAKMHEDFFREFKCKIITVPDIVSNTSKVSKLKPILWLLYSYFLSLKVKLFYNNFTVVSTTHHFLPFHKKQVITIHDLRPYFYPDSKLQQVYFRKILPKKIFSCEHIITVSESVKKLIVQHYKINSNKVSVVYNAIDITEFEIPNNLDEKINSNTLLSVGASWKHKNIHSLLDNYDLWRGKYNLIIVSGNTDYTKQLEKRVHKYGIDKHVSFVSSISFSQLKKLYLNAKALIYPSIDEGFGIPPLEAFASCTPVIVSDIPVFREILQDKAIYIDPNSKGDWQKAFNHLDELTANELIPLREYACKFDQVNMTNMVANLLKKI